MKKLIIALTVLIGTANAQKDIKIQLTPLYNGVPAQLNYTYNDVNNVAFKLTRVQFYINKFEITHDGGQTTNLGTSDNVLLSNYGITDHTIGSGNINNVESIDFKLGVDSSYNHLDPSTYPGAHPLANQTPNMHWGWSFGYKFIVIEADVDTDGDGTYETAMQCHVVGNEFVRDISLIISNSVTDANETIIGLNYDIAGWLTNVDMANFGFVHGGGTKNTEVTDNTIDYNVFSEGSATNIIAPKSFDANLSFDGTEIKFSSKENLTKIEVLDLSGKLIHTATINGSNGTLPFDAKNQLYIVRLSSNNGEFAQKLKM